MTSSNIVSQVKPLTGRERELATQRAADIVRQRIGERPVRRTFEREHGALFGMLDALALVVFVAALAISSMHILQYMAAAAADSYRVTSAGIIVSLDAYTVTHQIGALLLAEAAVLLFATVHAMSAPARAGRKPWLRAFSVPLALALLSAVFVLVANISGGTSLLVALLPPLTTLGLSMRLELLVSEAVRRRADVDTRYTSALNAYEAAMSDITTHRDYAPVLKSELFAALVRKPGNAWLADAAIPVKRAAVWTELQHEAVWHEDNALETRQTADYSAAAAPQVSTITNGAPEAAMAHFTSGATLPSSAPTNGNGRYEHGGA